MNAARRLKPILAALLVGASTVLALGVGSANAALVYPSAGEIVGPTPATTFTDLRSESVAVNGSNGHILVADSGSGRVYDFTDASDTTPDTWNGSTTPAGSFGVRKVAVAVDNSSGDVYVADSTHAVIDKFTASGNLIASFGDTTPTANGQLSGVATPAGPFSPAGVGSFGLAVDQSTHDLYAIDAGHEVIDVFNSTGAYQSQITATGGLLYGCGGNYADGIAVDPTSHHVFVSDSCAVQSVEFDSSGSFVKAFDGSNTPAGSFGGGYVSLALDNASGDLYVNAQEVVDVFDSSGSYVGQIKGSPSGAFGGVAVDQATHQVYVANPSTGSVRIFAAGVLVPDATTNAAGAVERTTATLHGHLDPVGGGNTTDCHFDYTDEASFQSSGFAGAQTAPCAEGDVQSAAADVHADISGLTTGTTYHFRLSVANSNGANSAAEQSFTTVVAVPLSTGSATAVGKNTATLNGTLNPDGVPLTSCQFDFTDEETFKSQGYTGAGTVPCAQSLGAIGSGTADVPVSADVGTLESGTRYRFRLEATNSFGTSVGQDEVLDTEGIGFGFKSFSFKLLDQAGDPYTRAGGHPYALQTDISFKTRVSPDGFLIPDQQVKDLNVSLPPGLVGNTQSLAHCTVEQLLSKPPTCPVTSQVGVLSLDLPAGGFSQALRGPFPVYNMLNPAGTPAQFGFLVSGVPTYIDPGVRTGSDYGIDSKLGNISSVLPLLATHLTLWGTPADPSHDPLRFCKQGSGGAIIGGCKSTAPLVPFLTNPTSCSGTQTVTARADSWQHPSDIATTADTLPANTGCNQLEFNPSLQARPTTNVADSPSGLSADVHIPQSNDVNTLSTSHLRKAVVTLPEGLVVNPASANGLGSCSPADVGMTSAVGAKPATFTPSPASCPDAAKLGTAEVDTPLLDHPVLGNVYAAEPFDNPFGTLLAIYVAASDPQSGVVVKLAGEVTPDPNTGRLITTFDETPQQPVGDFKLNLFGGAAAALRTPATCGTYSTTSVLTPWSAPDSGPPATPHDDWSITQGPNGACANSPGQEPLSPSFDAGTVSPIAGAFSPFVMHLRREDGSQQFASLTLTPPPGLLGKLAGTPECSEAQIAQAQNRDNPGDGATEKANPSCPAASQVGTVTAGAGAGPAPYYTTGKAYLAGPYKGAPLSLAIITPATAGPYDLGAVVVRTALRVDPATTQITAVSDPIPSILAGIPLDVRSIVLSLDKPNFTLNGTSCDPSAVNGSLLSTLGQAAPLSERFQLAECANLAFKPKLSLSLKGGIKRGKNPALRATLTMPPGGANIAGASVALPHSEFLDQSHIRTVCTRVQFAAEQCPPGSVYGKARAFSPLLDKPLEGPVYLRSSDNPLPDLVVDLNGQIHVVLDSRIDSVHGGIRNTFETVPDAPVSKFVLEMQGGKKGLLQNSTNICKGVNLATVRFDGQNGKTNDIRPQLTSNCKRKSHGRGAK